LSATYGGFYEQASNTHVRIAKKEALEQAETLSKLAEEVREFLRN